MIAALPFDEEERIRVLRSLEILDTAPETAFEALTRAAQQIAGTEMASVSLVDMHRQWFKASIGLDVSETARNEAFCAHTILEREPLLVGDTTKDPRFSDNPLVIDGLKLRSYAGAPIMVDGQNVGTVCAFSSLKREWGPGVSGALAALATAAAEHIDLRRRVAFKNRLLGTTSDGVLAADGEGRITYWNAAAERILGWTAPEALGRSVSMIVPESHRQKHEEGFARVRQAGRDGFGGRPVVVNALRKDGRETPVELTLASWNRGEDMVVAAVMRDCRERAALAEARAANLAKDRFLATISHELRTPLNGVVGLADVLARTPLTPAQEQMLDVMRAAGATLERLLSDILDSASLSAGELSLANEPFELTALLDRVVSTHRPTADAKRLALACSGPDMPVMLRADGDRLEQILDKLVGNAVKFTETGAVRLLVRRPEPDLWRFEVTDTGAGFSASIADRLFEPFRPGDDTTTRAHAGSGLGLCLSRQLARGMGGDLTAENRLEGGARLILTVPLPICDPLPSRAAA